MTDETTPHRMRRHPGVWWSRMKLKWPLIPWLAAIALFFWLYDETMRTAAVSGVVQTIHEDVAPVESARLVKIAVVEGQEVKAGDLIAEFDSTVLDAQMAETTAQMALEQSQLAARMAELGTEYQLEHTQMERQFENAINQAEIRQRDLKFRQALDQSRLDVLSNEIRQISQVMNTAVTDARDMIVYRSEMESLARGAALYPEAIRQTEADIAHGCEQLALSRTWTNSLAAATNAVAAQERIAAARDLIASLRERKGHYTIRATHDGTVSRLLHFPGEVIKASDPVVSLVARESQRVIAFVPEWLFRDINIGDTVLLTQRLRDVEPLRAKVTAIGPEILTLPPTASPVPKQPVRGRRVVIVANGPNDLMPGESVTVHVGQPWWELKFEQLWRHFIPGR